MQGVGFGPILGQAWSAATAITNRLTDFVYHYVPEDVSRSTVSWLTASAAGGNECASATLHSHLN